VSEIEVKAKEEEEASKRNRPKVKSRCFQILSYVAPAVARPWRDTVVRQKQTQNTGKSRAQQKNLQSIY